jgi:hypothetical protein
MSLPARHTASPVGITSPCNTFVVLFSLLLSEREPLQQATADLLSLLS